MNNFINNILKKCQPFSGRYIYIALFIKSVWRKNAYKYTHGRPAIMDNIKKTDLLLPTKSDGTPDWQFMENYIKSLPYSDNI